MTGDTIAAVSTAPGEGGIGIIRVSGNKAAEILGNIFVRPGETGSAGKEFADKTMYYGNIIDPSSSETVDEVLVVFMKGPKSYTGEDVCEIQCHGGNVPLKRILEIVIRLGATAAQPGEFTKRAFLNGRIDLLQAGAVIDLIKSKTALGYHAAKEQTEGRVSEKIREVRDDLLDVLAEIAVQIDYPDETDGEGKKQEDPVFTLLEKAEAGISELLEGADTGRMIRDGLRVAITGKPNTGKSSLFNAMAREDAAIVTATPGTTRDALEIWLDIRGIPVLLSDTAGIHDSDEEIETLGIERAKEQYNKSDVSILMLDGSRPLTAEDRSIAESLDTEKKHIVVISKSDLPAVFRKSDAAELIPFEIKERDIIHISLIDDGASSSNKKHEAIEAVENQIEKFVSQGVSAGSSLLVTKALHKSLLEYAKAEIEEAKKELTNGAAPEFTEVNIRAAWNALGEMIGERISDDIINRVFEDFCVGK